MYNRYGDNRGEVWSTSSLIGEVDLMVEISEELKKFIKIIPLDILGDLWKIVVGADLSIRPWGSNTGAPRRAIRVFLSSTQLFL